MRQLVLGLVVAATVSLPLSTALAKAKAKGPDATLQLSQGSVAAGIGFSWGSGTLTYKGKRYPMSVDGLSVGSVGISRATASGSVTHLKSLEDFNGTYTAVGAGATVAGGGSIATMQNQNGVRITLKSTSRGIKFTLGAAGVNMQIKQ
jgi:hypothetical protein